MYAPPAGGLITRIEWERSGASNAIDVSAFEIDGVILKDNATSTTLTLQNDQDLDLFEAGDQVKTIGTVSYAAVPEPSDFPGDPFSEAGSTINATGSPGSAIEFVYAKPSRFFVYS